MRHFSIFSRCASRWALTLAVLSLLGVVAGAQAGLRYAGSDTAEPVIEAAQAAYGRGHPGFKLEVQDDGTPAGLRELCAGKAALVGATRQLTPDEAKACVAAGIQPLLFPVALDAVALVVPSSNIWLAGLTLAEVRTLFGTESAGRLTSWKQVRPGFPDLPIRTAGIAVEHNTFDFFLERMGMKKPVRADFKAFPEHVETGRYVAGEAGAIGFMSISDAVSLQGQVRMIGIDFGQGAVAPRTSALRAGKYSKLTRPVYLYVNPALLSKTDPQDVEFLTLLIKDMESFVNFAHLIPLPQAQYKDNIKRASFQR